jgi:hypothetical protein
MPCLEENQFITEQKEAPMAQPGNTEALSPRMWPSTPAGCGISFNFLDYEDRENYYKTELKPSYPDDKSPILRE